MSNNFRSKFDIVIVGGGVLGTTLAYWLSLLYEGKIAVIEKEAEVGRHATRRNTGVVHRPFYLDPEKKKIFAQAALLSYPLWERYAQLKGLPWKQVGTIEVALDKDQVKTIKEYQKWALRNGLKKEEIEILDEKSLKKIEPNIICAAALFCKTDVSTDFEILTKNLQKDTEAQGVDFLLNLEVDQIRPERQGLSLFLKDGEQILCRFLINCAGGNALRIAHLLGIARDLTDLNFRGEYWVVNSAYIQLARHNIYSIPRHKELPFLDPHWVVRWDDQVVIGPNAVPVIGPYTYEGFAESIFAVLKKIFERPRANKLKLLINPEFLELTIQEWKSSFFKKEMVRRIKQFLPKLKSEYLIQRGVAGIRSQVIDKQGSFVKEAVEIFGPRSFHILNFNSPGATGTPAYTARIVKLLEEKGRLNHLKRRAKPIKFTPWNFKEISLLLNSYK